jgi:predicted ABC-type ATPase
VADRKLPNAFCTIIAGPNGSGKSTIYPLLSPVGEFLNADDLARRLRPDHPETVSMAAGRLLLRTIDRAVQEQRSFVYETTLSSRQSLSVMERCRSLGYEVALVYVALDGPDLNVRRVAERVSRGGHHIPETVIRRRYEKAFFRLPTAVALSHTSLFLDNSSLQPQMLLIIDRGRIVANHLDVANSMHTRLARTVGTAIGLSADAVLHRGR